MFIPASSRENQLLLCVARRSLDETTSRKIEILLREDSLDWDYLFEAARAHGVTALLAQHLRPFSALVSASVMSEILDKNGCHVQQCLFLAGKLAKIVAALNDEDISCLAFKGPTLALMAYADLALRQFADLDIVIRKRDMQHVKQILERQGFASINVTTRAREAALLRFDHAYAFRNDDEVILDVHWRFAPVYFSLHLESDELWRRAQPLDIAGRKVMSLSAEDLLLVLCCHGFTHQWERLVWICDVAGLIERHDLDWGYVLARAKRLGILRILCAGLLLARELGASLPPRVDDRLEEDAVVTTFVRRVGSDIFHKQRGQAGLREELRNQLALRERVRDKITVLGRFALTPRYYDWKWVSIPPALVSLYYVVRPIRMARNRAARLRNGDAQRT